MGAEGRRNFGVSVAACLSPTTSAIEACQNDLTVGPVSSRVPKQSRCMVYVKVTQKLLQISFTSLDTHLAYGQEKSFGEYLSKKKKYFLWANGMIEL